MEVVQRDHVDETSRSPFSSPPSQHLATLETYQDEVIVDIKDLFRELLTKAFEKPKIGLDDDEDADDAIAQIDAEEEEKGQDGSDQENEDGGMYGGSNDSVALSSGMEVHGSWLCCPSLARVVGCALGLGLLHVFWV